MEPKLDVDRLRLIQYLNECDKHILKINHAVNKMKSFMPLTVQKFDLLNEDDKEHIDQLIFRYTKLQDAIGERVFPYILKNLKEDIERKSFRDLLNRLEKLEIIESADMWDELRKGRNILSHEYSSKENELVDNINEIFNKNIPMIFSVYDRVLKYLKETDII